jgi:glutamate-1-semialdehyde 2,1-aminomutase
VLVFEKGYHGGTLWFSQANPLHLPHSFVYGVFNDIERTRQKIDIEVGAIIVEPAQFLGGAILASREFLQFLWNEATRIGAVLIFDEVVTSRAYYGAYRSSMASHQT